MDAVDTNQPDGREGPVDLEHWIDTLARLHGELQAAMQRINELETEVAELKKQQAGLSKPAKVEEPFSLRSEEKRQEDRGQKRRFKESRRRRRGRIANEEKIRNAERTEAVYPSGIPHEQCRLSHVRVVWRLENNRAVRVAYQIFRGPQKQYGIIPGVLGRSEFGLEIVITLAYLVHMMGLSFDKVCAVMGFLQDLKLSKSQADALLRQLACAWSEEFEILCTLLANSLVVHADETSWSIHSVWALLSEKARLLVFGVHKDAATLQEFLDPETFEGLLVSDDAAVYANFTSAQKCWAHLLRKAIKLTLLDAQNENYRVFADGLLEIFHEANRIQRDQRLSDAGRRRKVDALVDEVFELCGPVWFEDPPPDGPDHDRRLLAVEVMRLALREELFAFVTTPAATQPNGASKAIDGTNNEAERTLRNPAQARTTGRTSKTSAGARRTSILTSVLESLRLYLPTYTLKTVIEEIKGWQETGRSCFRALMERLKLSLPDHSVLERVQPLPSG